MLSSSDKEDKVRVKDVAACETSGGWQTNQFGTQLVDVDSDRVAPHMTSRLAALNRELKALEVRYFRTRLQLEKSMEKVRFVHRSLKSCLWLLTTGCCCHRTTNCATT